MLDTVAGELKFLLRLPPDLHAALVEISKQDTRSLNGQIVHILRQYVAAQQSERLK